MKRSFLLVLSLCAALLVNAQLSKTINLTTAGTLASVLTADEKKTITDLTVTGNIDARDFKTMRDSMAVLANIDLTTAKVVAYTENGENWTAYYFSNEIPIYAFHQCTHLKSISIPNSVTSINDESFSYCGSLMSIIIPNSVLKIGKRAFSYCSCLKTIEIPSSVTKISSYMLSNCDSLKTVIIPNSVISIGANAFSGCSSLNSIKIPNTIMSIDNSAFAKCTNLSSVDIPNSVTTIGTFVCDSCSNLTTVNIASTVIAGNCFRHCTGLVSVNIAPTVKEIRSGAFVGCSSLKTLSIPSTINVISSGSFSGCLNLSIEVDPENPNYSSENGVLFNKTKTVLHTVPASKSNSYVIPSSVKEIGASAFVGCRYLTSVTIPLSVTAIGSTAFFSCQGLSTIIIPSSVTSIEQWAFTNCSNLKVITIPSSVTSMGKNVFYYCIASIKNRSKTPPLIQPLNNDPNFTFDGCTLYVPTGSKAAYETAEDWSKFHPIIEYTADSLFLSDKEISLNNTETTKVLGIITDDSWAIANDCSWLNISSTSGTGDGVTTITAQYNPTGATRKATISVLNQNISKTITITQTATTTAIADSQPTATDLLYPNPASSSITIPASEAARVFVYNSTGQLVLTKDIAGKEDVSIEALAAGLYKVCVETAAGVAVYGLVKE